MNCYAVDFETHYDKEYSIKTLGVDAYINHELFDPYLVAVWGPGIEFVGNPRDFDWSQLHGKTLLAHNVRFDETVFLRCQELGIIPKGCIPKEWFCTADLSVYLSAPRNLSGAASALLGEVHDKGIRDKLGKITYKEACAQGLKDDVDHYGLTDARLCYELWDKFSHRWSDFERRLSLRNRLDGRKGVRIDVRLLKENLEGVKLIRWEAEKHIPWDWSKNKTPLSPKGLRLECRKAGIPCPTSLAQDDVGCMQWEDTYGEQYPWVGAMRDWRRSNIMLKRLETIERRLQGDIFPYSIKYFGAHTGRYSGDGGFNMQNMPRNINMGVNLRHLFIPREGKKMVIADLAQIEPRVLLWLVKDTKTLEAIRNGFSVYEAHAIQTMDWSTEKGNIKDLPEFYKLAKARVIGLGYGCGAAKFKAVAKKMADLDMTLAESQKNVTEYRASNPKITGFWSELQRDCAWSRGDTFTIELPSDRELTFYDVRNDRNGLSAALQCHGGRREKLYGGRLTENVTQAIARDVFAEGMMNLNDAGLDQLFHSHDEQVLEVDQDVKESDIAEILATTPDWLEGCPVEAEVTSVKRYCKM